MSTINQLIKACKIVILVCVLLFTNQLYSQIVTVKDGAATGFSVPIEPYYNYGYTQQIYLQSEIATSGTIYKLYFEWNGNSSRTETIVVYMGHTSKSSFSNTSDWVSTASMTQVFSGSYAVTSSGWYSITLDSPFAYNNTDNLVIAVDKNTGSAGSASDEFYTIAAASRSLEYHNDITNPSPAAPPTATTLNSYVPSLKLGICSSTYSGTYEVGATGTWSTLTAAISSLSVCMTDDVILELQSTYDDSGETFPIDFSSLPTTSAITLTVRPKTGVNAQEIISSSATGTILFAGNDYVYFDGRPGGSGSMSTANNLIVGNTSTSGYVFKFISDATYNKIEYCNIKGVNTSTTNGTIWFSTASSTGNDYNQINYCEIFDGATKPTNAIYSLGSATYTNSNNTINGNYIYNFFNASSNSAGIFLSDYNTDWTITNNKLYQTSAVDLTSNVSHRPIYITYSSGSGNNFTVTGNTIGYASSSATGVYDFTGHTTATAAGVFTGIHLKVGTTTASTVSANTIAGITLSDIRGSASTSVEGAFNGIAVLGGSVTIGSSGNANIIGSSSSTGSITFYSGASGNRIFGVYLNTTGTVTVAYNTIGGFSTGASSAAGIAYEFAGVYNYTTGTITISNNTIGSTSTSNSIAVGLSTTTAANLVYGIQNAAAATINFVSNTIQNLTNYTTSGSAVLYGIYNASGATSTAFTSNTISTLKMMYDNSTSGSSASPITCGIYNGSTVTTTLTSNTVTTITCKNGLFKGFNLSSTATHTINSNTITDVTVSTAAATTIYGVYNSTTGTYNMQSNSIKNLISTSTSAHATEIAGIYFNGVNLTSTLQKNIMSGFSCTQTSTPIIYGVYNSTSGSVLLYNNLFICSNGGNTNNCKIFGVYDNGSTVITAYYNTFSITGSASSGADNPSSACFAHPGTTLAKVTALKNNIFQNSRTGSTNRNYSIYLYSLSTPVNTAGNIDYNYYAAADDSYFYYSGSALTSASANSSTRGYGGTNSKYYSTGGGNNSAAITVNSDGSLSTADLATVTTGADLDATSGCEVDIYYVSRNSSGGYKGCYEGACLVISSNPSAGNICVGGTYSPSITATNSASLAVTFAYQYQFSTDDNTFANVADGTPANSTYTNGSGTSASVSAGATSAAMSASVTGSIAAGSSYYYRCLVTSSAGCAVYTTSAQLTINAVPSISVQPTAETICVGGTYSPTITATGGTSLTYQWQFSTDNSSWGSVANGTPANSSYSNATSNTLSESGNVAAGSAYYYRCVVSDAGSGCSSVNSSSAQLTINAVPSISSQPTAGNICVGGTYSPSVTATGGVSLSYQWQFSTDNSSWGSVADGTPANSTYTNGTTATLTETGNVAAGSAYYYRCVVSSTGTGCSSVNSNGVQLTINADPSISVQPTAGNICVGGTYSPTITATGGTSLTYQWQFSTDNSSWGSVADGTPANSTYTNGTTNTLTESGNVAAGSAYYYRCVVSDAGSGCGSVNSNGVQLTINADPSISVQPTAGNICVGGTYSPTITATGGTSLTYQWQFSTDNSSWGSVADGTPANSTYTNATTNTLTESGSVAAGTSYYYRCVVSDAGSGCGSVNSNGVQLTINALPTITTAATPAVVTGVTYNAGAQQTSLTYTASTNSPTSYSIDWTSGITDQGSTAHAFAGGGSTISDIDVTAGVAAGTYTGTMTFTNANGCSGTKSITITITAGSTIYYYDGSGSMSSTANWGTNTDGTGSNPADLTSGSITFYVLHNGGNSTPSNDATWTLGASSKIIVGDGTNATNFTITSGNTITGTIDVANNGTLTIADATSPTLGTINSGSTIAYACAGSSQSLPSGTAYGSLTINNSNGVSLGGNASVSGTLALTAGTLTVGANTLTMSGSSLTRGTGNINASNGSALVSFTNGSALALPASCFTGNVNQMTLNGAGGVTLGSNTTVASTLTLTSGTLTLGANTLTLANNSAPVRTAGNIDATNAAAEVEFTNTAAVTLPASLFSGSVSKWKMNGTGGITLNGNTTVSGTLTLTSGKLIIPASTTLSLGTTSSNLTLSGGSSSSYLVNTDNTTEIRRYVNSNTSYVFPMGDATYYTPMTFTLNSNGGLSSAYLSTYVVDAITPGFAEANFAAYISRYWSVAQSGMTSPNYDISYSYDDTDITGTESTIVPVKVSGGTWYKPSNSTNITNGTSEGTGSITVGSNTLTWAGLTTFSFDTGAGDEAAALPISLLSFTAKPQTNRVRLDWATASEENNDYFTVERSIDGQIFTELFKKPGAGISTTNLYYFGYDTKPLDGVSYYRLKQTDYNGHYSYSQVESVVFGTPSVDALDLNIYPNPAENGKFHVIFDAKHQETYHIAIYDAVGKLVYYQDYEAEKGVNDHIIELQGVASGMYQLEIRNDSIGVVTRNISM